MATYIECPPKSWLPGERPMDRDEIAKSTDVPALKSRLTYLFNQPAHNRSHLYYQQDQIEWIVDRLDELIGQVW